MPAHAAAPENPGNFEIKADGYYGTFRFDFGGDVPIAGSVPDLEGNATVGMVQNEVNSEGIEGQDGDVYSRSIGSLIDASAMDTEIPTHFYAAEQVALPEKADPDTVGVHDLGVPGIGNLRGISSEVKANWNDDVLGHGSQGGVLTELYSGVGQLDLVDAGEVGQLSGILSSMAPVDLPVGDGPLFSMGEGQLLQESGVFGKEDGSQGAYLEVSGRFSDLNLLGGAENGGITVGLAAASDTEEPNAWGRLEATGEPGGASFDYELPALELQVGGQEGVEIEPGFDETFEVLPGVSVNINFADYRDDDIEVADDGTYVAASGGGLSARLIFSLPVPVAGDIELGHAEMGILSFPEASVEVPQGGLYADGGDDEDDDDHEVLGVTN
ncbi:hypothetical protein [Phytoactinopolyspora halophila]|uniref:hypothetical protein n=1 Tax=Phytoactinopolyspora halophila TaxID=1981511 RepID=UPI000F504B9F|nr:hypothetical protein [Phytoactinopolyspora halophila]